MATLKEAALAYEPKRTHNIAELEAFDVSEKIEKKKGTNTDGEGYEYFVLIRDGEEYRIPNGVMENIKNIIEVNTKHNKQVTNFSVEKTGEGMKSKYTIVTLDEEGEKPKEVEEPQKKE